MAIAADGPSLTRIVKKFLNSAGISRSRVASLRLVGERYVLAATYRRPPRPRGRILCYHSVGQPEFGVNDASPWRFRRQIELALGLGYRFLPAQAIAQTGGIERDLAITFDDGWISCLTTAAPILAEYRIPWTLFVVAGWSDHAESWTRDRVLNWEKIGRLRDSGVAIGSHSMTHPDFAKISPVQVQEELAKSRELIGARLGFLPEEFAIPWGQSKNWNDYCTTAALQSGYRQLYAQAEDTRSAGTIGRTFVTSFDSDYIFRGLLDGAFDRWEEWF